MPPSKIRRRGLSRENQRSAKQSTNKSPYSQPSRQCREVRMIARKARSNDGKGVDRSPQFPVRPRSPGQIFPKVLSV